MKRFAVGLGIVITIAAGAGAVLHGLHSERAMAPAVEFMSLKGERIPMAALRGKVVLVEFWATDCAICVKEMPDLVAAHEQYRSVGLETIAVAMRYDPPNYVIAYAERNRLPFTVAFDPVGDVAKAFGDVNLTPTTFLIDRRGVIVTRIVGQRDFIRLRALIEQKLKEPG